METHHFCNDERTWKWTALEPDAFAHFLMIFKTCIILSYDFHCYFETAANQGLSDSIARQALGGFGTQIGEKEKIQSDEFQNDGTRTILHCITGKTGISLGRPAREGIGYASK